MTTNLHQDPAEAQTFQQKTFSCSTCPHWQKSDRTPNVGKCSISEQTTLGHDFPESCQEKFGRSSEEAIAGEKVRARSTSKKPKKRTLIPEGKPTVEELVQQAYQLPKYQIEELVDSLQALLAALDSEELRAQEETKATDLSTLINPKLRGRIELKLINGYGPYAYLRWRSGGVYKSHYLGKAKKGGES